MKKTTWFVITDGLAATVMLTLLMTGIVVRWVLPPGSGRRWTLWGWNRHDWGDLHFWLAVVLLTVIVVHVALHWTWVVTIAKRLTPTPAPGSGPPGSGTPGSGTPGSGTPGSAGASAVSRGTKIIAAVLTVIVLIGVVEGFRRIALAQVRQSSRTQQQSPQ